MLPSRWIVAGSFGLQTLPVPTSQRLDRIGLVDVGLGVCRDCKFIFPTICMTS